MKKALAIDGNSLFYRMYYATQNQVEYALKHQLTPNNAIKLVLSIIDKIIKNNSYEYVFIAFDNGKKTFRHEMDESYKSGRQATPDELIKQMLDTIEMLKALGYCVMSKEGIEADDLVGSFSHLMSKNKIYTDIYSSDKDLLQLVNEYTTVKLIKTGISHVEEYNFTNFQSKFFGLLPKQIIEFKGIVGDKSDHLPGINGIGEKTGISLLLQYNDLDNIYKNVDNLSNTLKEKIIRDYDIAIKCKKMATILVNQFESYEINFFTSRDKNFDKINSLVKKYKLSNLDFLSQQKLF